MPSNRALLSQQSNNQYLKWIPKTENTTKILVISTIGLVALGGGLLLAHFAFRQGGNIFTIIGSGSIIATLPLGFYAIASVMHDIKKGVEHGKDNLPSLDDHLAPRLVSWVARAILG